MFYSLTKIVYRYVLCKFNIHTLLNHGFENKLSSLDISRIKGNKDVLFILGSGSSINSISENGWRNISNNVSIGLNYWPIHDFIPSLLMFEIPRRNRAEYFFNILHEKKLIYHDVPMLLKGLYKNRKDFDDIYSLYELFPKALLPNVYLCQEFSIPGRDEHEYLKSLNFLFNSGFFKEETFVKSIAQYRGTVMCAITLGIKAGFKKIVLCGVDLNNTKYFYEENRKYYESLGLRVPPTGQEGLIHKTNISLKGTMPISMAISKLNQIFNKRMNGKIYVSSKDSALFPELDYYEI